jgi:two-component system, LuxR family, response regulator FixJ
MSEGNSLNTMPVVFLVEDDEPVRKAINLLMMSAGLVCESYSSGKEFLEVYDPKRPGCVVTDMRMPGISGLDLQERLTAMDPAPPVIIITGHGDVPAAVRAMKQGALDFIEKPFGDQALLDAVQRAIDRDLSSRESQKKKQAVVDLLSELTPREKEVCDLVVEGLPNKLIADQLHLSVKTVEFHRANVMKKLDVESIAALVKVILKSR